MNNQETPGVGLEEGHYLNTVIDYFGGATQLARVLGIHPNNVTNWKRRGIIPTKRALEIAYLSKGELKLNLMLPGLCESQQ